MGWAARCTAVLLLLGGAFARAQSSGEVDAAQWIAQAEARLGSGSGTVTLDRATHLDRPVTLGANHNLVIDSPLRITRGTVRLAGHNNVRCNAHITTDVPAAIFTADGATDISISGCHATAVQPAGWLLVASRSSEITVTGNVLEGMGIFTTQNGGGPKNETTRVTITGNSSTFPKGGGEMGVYLLFVQHAVIANNRFEGNTHGVEWWGGNANGDWGGPKTVVNAGDISVTGNVCLNIAGACVWGSVGYNVAISGNSADGCGDVCFDVEGGIDNVFSGNSARNCNYGCYAAEFESLNTSFTGNLASSEGDHVLVLIKHGPGHPHSHTNMAITGNTFTCFSRVCAALYTEGDDGLVFANNVITNGTIATLNYHNDFRVTGNTFRFTLDIGAQAAINGPRLFNHHYSEISGNFIRNEVESSKPDTCIGQESNDYNESNEMWVLRNTCIGFSNGIVTNSFGTNPGRPRSIWLISGNHVSAAPGHAYVRLHASGNEVYNFMADNTEEAFGGVQTIATEPKPQ